MWGAREMRDEESELERRLAWMFLKGDVGVEGGERECLVVVEHFCLPPLLRLLPLPP